MTGRLAFDRWSWRLVPAGLIQHGCSRASGVLWMWWMKSLMPGHDGLVEDSGVSVLRFLQCSDIARCVSASPYRNLRRSQHCSKRKKKPKVKQISQEHVRWNDDHGSLLVEYSVKRSAETFTWSIRSRVLKLLEKLTYVRYKSPTHWLGDTQ